MGIACGLGGQNQSVFHEQTYLYSVEQEFVTPHKANDSTHVQCGVKPEIRIKNREPLQETLYTNDTFTAGDFPVTIIRATGSNGVFSGEGYVQVPYLLDTKIKVKFDGIKINTERQLFEGKLVTSYDKTEQNVFEVPIIKSIESAIKAIEKIFKNQKDIAQKQESLEKQLADNKIDKEKYKQESEKIKEEIAQNDKSLDAVSQYIKESPTLTEADKENTINQVNSEVTTWIVLNIKSVLTERFIKLVRNFVFTIPLSIFMMLTTNRGSVVSFFGVFE